MDQPILSPAEPTYPAGQIPTEQDIDTYYEYNVDLIKAVLHNFSSAGLDAKHPRIEYSRCRDEVTVQRNESEEVTMNIDYRDRSLMISVCDPHVEDPYYEMTVIILSQKEMRVLRSLLDKLA